MKKIIKNSIILLSILFALFISGFIFEQVDAACPPSYTCPPFLTYVTPPNLVSCSQPCGTANHSISCPGGTQTFSVNYGASCTSCPGSSGTTELRTYCCSNDPNTCNTVCKRGVNNTSSWTAQRCTHNGNCANPLQCDPPATWTGSEVCCNGSNTSTCYKGEIFTRTNSIDCYGTPPGGGGCTPSCPASSTYCAGNEPNDGCGGTCPTGTGTPSCPDPNTYCAGDEPDDGCGGVCPTGTKPPSCPAASTYCAGSEPADGCGGVCPTGTKDCTGPPPPPLPIATGFLRIWDGSRVVKLVIKSITDVLATGKGVVKVATISGDSDSALDLVETTEADASSIRVRTPYGTKACRKAMDFCQVNITGNTELLSDVVATYDGGYAAIGQISTGGNDIIIIKYKANGVIDWARTIGGGSVETARALMQTADGSLIILGSTQSYGQGSYDLFLAKFSSTGTFIWAKAVGTSNNESADSISPTSDGGYIVSGQSSSPLGVLLVKFFGDDSLAWARNIRENGPYTSIYPGGYPNSVIQASDGNYLVAGILYSDIYGRAALMKVSEDGSSVLFSSGISRWFSGMTYVLSGHSVVEAADNNGYLLSGYIDCWSCSSANGTGIVAKLNPTDGSLIWAKSISAGIADARITSMINTVDGGYAVSGAGGYHAIRILSSITKLDSDANRTWQKVLPRVLNIPYRANSLAQTMDGGFVAVGTKSNDALIMKVDDEGLACFGNDYGTLTINPGSNYSGFSFAVAMSNVTLTEQTVASPTITTPNFTETNCCGE